MAFVYEREPRVPHKRERSFHDAGQDREAAAVAGATLFLSEESCRSGVTCGLLLKEEMAPECAAFQSICLHGYHVFRQTDGCSSFCCMRDSEEIDSRPALIAVFYLL